MKDNKEHNSYIGGLINGVSSLLTGTKTTMTVLCRKGTTEQYPENQKTLKLSECFGGMLTMPYNEQDGYRCVACDLCQVTYPNDTTRVTSETIETEDSEKKKILTKYECDLGSCIFCQLCVNVYPHDAITFDQDFGHAVFDRSKLVLTLNHPGSHVGGKKESTAPQAEVTK